MSFFSKWKLFFQVLESFDSLVNIKDIHYCLIHRWFSNKTFIENKITLIQQVQQSVYCAMKKKCRKNLTTISMKKNKFEYKKNPKKNMPQRTIKYIYRKYKNIKNKINVIRYLRKALSLHGPFTFNFLDKTPLINLPPGL